MERVDRFHRRLTCRGPDGLLEKLLFSLLIPCGWLYGVLGLVRVMLYRSRVFPVFRAGVPVVSVGNLSVGGTGKTPMVDYLVKFFLARGRRVAVVSRGYGVRAGRGVLEVCRGAGALLGPEKCGDEPFLLARRNPQVRVYVAPRRREGVRLAVEQGAEVILLDDGFQHLAVARDLDIVLLDARRPLGNGHPLPAGLLRERPSALGRADLYVYTRSDGASRPGLPLEGPAMSSRHVLVDEALSLEGERVPLHRLAGLKGVAFAGIADPEGFFSAVRGKGLHLLRTLALPDHAIYDGQTLERLAGACAGADFLVTTEKDGVKLRADDFPLPCFQIPLSLQFSEESVLEGALESLFG